MRSTVAAVGALICALMGLTACASTATPGPAHHPSVSPIAYRLPNPMQLRFEGDQRHVEATATVNGTTADCGRDFVVSVTADEADAVFIEGRFQTNNQACPGTHELVAHVVIPTPHGRMLAADGIPWTVGPDHALHACDATWGCAGEPTKPCDPRWVDVASRQGELPTERQYDLRGCSGRWMVLDMHFEVTGCQPLDGQQRPAGCTTTHARWFLHFDNHRWTVVANAPGPGCAAVHAEVPEFPTALCERLPAL